ncbi:MAG: hypothetical protein P9M15_05275, partial [Candidatus Electryoneaceae bacterium]|nr:hypothetical protein [Candidatus Electryoneaceae bacterium]
AIFIDGKIDSGTIGEAIEIITDMFDTQTDEERLNDLRARKATLTLEYRAIGNNIHAEYEKVTGYFGRSFEARAKISSAQTEWRVGQREYVLPLPRGAGSDWMTQSQARIVVALESEQSPVIRASGKHTIYVCLGNNTTPDIELRPNETLPEHYLKQRFTLHELGLTGDSEHHLESDWFLLEYHPLKNVFYSVRLDDRKIIRKVYGLLDIEPDLCIGLNEGWNVGGRLSESDEDMFHEFHLMDLNGFSVPGDEGFQTAYLQMAMSRFQLLIHDDGTLVNISTSGKPIFVLDEDFQKKIALLPITKGDFFQEIKNAQDDRQRLEAYQRALHNIDDFVERATMQNNGQHPIRTQLDSGDLIVAGHAVLRYRRPTPTVVVPKPNPQPPVEPEPVRSKPVQPVQPVQPAQSVQPQPGIGTLADRPFMTIGWTLSADNIMPRTLKRAGQGIVLTESTEDETPLFSKRPHEIQSFAQSGVSGIIRRPRNNDRFTWEDMRGGLIIELRTDELSIKHQVSSDEEKWELYVATDATGSVNVFASCEAGAKWLGADDTDWMDLTKPLARIPSGRGVLWLAGSGRSIMFSS